MRDFLLATAGWVYTLMFCTVLLYPNLWYSEYVSGFFTVSALGAGFCIILTELKRYKPEDKINYFK